MEISGAVEVPRVLDAAAEEEVAAASDGSDQWGPDRDRVAWEPDQSGQAMEPVRQLQSA